MQLYTETSVVSTYKAGDVVYRHSVPGPWVVLAIVEDKETGESLYEFSDGDAVLGDCIYTVDGGIPDEDVWK